jgi:DAK2 domain fusion protein YloV
VYVLDALDAAAVRRWSQAALAAIVAHQPEIDDLNVFPIPDGDTGTNLVLTLRSADAALQADGAQEAAPALRAYATGAVLGARGNSGVIVSQLLRSFADAAVDHPSCDAEMVRAGLRLAAAGARGAVAEPVEGTILTVANAAATGLPPAGASLAEILCAAAESADAALQRTPGQLAALGAAGVVDAGGRGLVLLLDALARVVGAHPNLTAPGPTRRDPVQGTSQRLRESGSSIFGYEVQYLLDTDEVTASALRSTLAALGDSVVVVGTGTGTWNVHAHVNDVGAAIEAGIEAGRPHRVSVVRFADQPRADQPRADRPRADRPRADQPGADQPGAGHNPDPGTDHNAQLPAGDSAVALIAIAPGDGLERLFGSEGVSVVGGADPSVAEVVAAIRASTAPAVVLLPNISVVVGVAEQAAELSRADGIRVAVVPTRAPVQALAAIAVHVNGRRFDDDVVAMAEAAAATRFAEILVADSEALTSIGVCQAGDVLGLIDGDVVEIGHSLLSVAFSLADRLIGVGAELMTVLVGADAQPGVGEVLRKHVRERSSLTEVQVYEVGQPHSPLIIGVE